MFSGQGSQYYGMGYDLYCNNSSFRAHVDALDEIVTDVAGISLVKVIFNPEKQMTDTLDDTVLSGLSIFLIECALARSLLDNGIVPDYVLGSSAGMFASCVLAESLDEEQAVKLIYDLGSIYQELCIEGRMIAVLDAVDMFYDSPLLTKSAEIAAVNFSNSFVISLPAENLPVVESYLKSGSKIFQVMPVSRAYHSRWIDEARSDTLELLAACDFHKPVIPVVCCSKGQRLNHVDSECLWHSIRDRLLFQKSILDLEQSGPHRYIDAGPSGTMAAFSKYGLPAGSKSEAFTILSPFKQDTK